MAVVHIPYSALRVARLALAQGLEGDAEFARWLARFADDMRRDAEREEEAVRRRSEASKLGWSRRRAMDRA
jgi:hypothetical protein